MEHFTCSFWWSSISHPPNQFFPEKVVWGWYGKASKPIEKADRVGTFRKMWSTMRELILRRRNTDALAGVALKNHIKKKTAENPHSLWRYVNAG